VSLQNLLPRVSQRLLIVLVGAAATTGAVVINLRHYQDFLLLLGSVFVPLFGVLLADWLLAGARYSDRDFFAGPAVRPEQLFAWIVGFALYQWLSPNGPAWWTRLVEHVHPAHVGFTASLPSFGAAFGLTLAVRALDSARAAPRARREPLARSR
jgi:purine-cytosine permease-like protein